MELELYFSHEFPLLRMSKSENTSESKEDTQPAPHHHLTPLQYNKDATVSPTYPPSGSTGFGRASDYGSPMALMPRSMGSSAAPVPREYDSMPPSSGYGRGQRGKKLRSLFHGLMPFWLSGLFLWALTVTVLLGVYRKTDPRQTLEPKDLSLLPLPTKRATILQFNDIYELIQFNDRGGLSRAVAQRKRYEKANPNNTISIFSGDLFSPSALSAAFIDPTSRERLNGIQMVNVTNLLFDMAGFGNHEFDLKEKEFTQRLRESRYPWVSTNIKSRAFPPGTVHRYLLRTVGGIRMGFIGTCVDSINPHYVEIETYTGTLKTVQKTARYLRKHKDVEFVVLISHDDMPRDIRMVQEQLGVDLVLGGHNHENMLFRVSNEHVTVAKADSNIRTFFVHEVFRNPDRDHTVPVPVNPYTVRSELISVTKDMPCDPQADHLIAHWWAIASRSFASENFNLEEVVTEIPRGSVWDGRNIVMRRAPTGLSDLVAKSIEYCAQDMKLSNFSGAFYNVGMIRVDDIVGPGEVTVYDVLRILPYLNVMAIIDISGERLLEIFKVSFTENILLGGFMQLGEMFSRSCTNVDALRAHPNNEDPAMNCKLNGEDVVLDKMYALATNKFLLTGKERNLRIMSPEQSSDIRLVKDTKLDFRRCFIRYLKETRST